MIKVKKEVKDIEGFDFDELVKLLWESKEFKKFVAPKMEKSTSNLKQPV